MNSFAHTSAKIIGCIILNGEIKLSLPLLKIELVTKYKSTMSSICYSITGSNITVQVRKHARNYNFMQLTVGNF